MRIEANAQNCTKHAGISVFFAGNFPASKLDACLVVLFVGCWKGSGKLFALFQIFAQCIFQFVFFGGFSRFLVHFKHAPDRKRICILPVYSHRFYLARGACVWQKALTFPSGIFVGQDAHWVAIIGNN